MASLILSNLINVARTYAVHLDLCWLYRAKCVRMLISVHNNYITYFSCTFQEDWHKRIQQTLFEYPLGSKHYPRHCSDYE